MQDQVVDQPGIPHKRGHSHQRRPAHFAADDQPAIELNKEKMEKFLPEMRKYYYDPAKYKTYMEQSGIQYPTARK